MQLKDANKYIGKRGYVIRKSILNEKQISEVKNELTVKPFVNSDYGKEEEPFKVYLENEGKLYIPRSYGIEKFGPPELSLLPQGKDININFNLNLKEEQKKPAAETIKAYHEHGGGILSLPCGFGKTIMALYFIWMLKKKTLVIVHKEFLMNQWIERIKFALPDAKVGTIQGSIYDVEGKDIVIGMLQTLSMREFEKDSFDDFGHVIIDECHRIPSRVFSKALTKITCKYMLGLSATPKRTDGLMKVVIFFIGNIVYSVKNSGKNVVSVKRFLLESNNDNYKQEVVNYRGSAQMPTMINNITEYYKRTELVIMKVLEEIKNNPQRHILVLSDRKKHLEDMYKICIQNGFDSVGYYVGGMKKDDLHKSESKKIIFATCVLVAEGFDIPTLNMLVLTSPKSDIIQIIGRIDRKIHDNIQALIYDFVDNFSMFENQGRKRFAVYKKNKFEIEDININIETNNIKFSKKYDFHNNQDDNNNQDNIIYDSDDNDNSCSKSKKTSKIDTEYNDINPKTNKKVNSKFIKNKEESIESVKKKNIDDLFNSISLFSDN